MAYYYVVSHRFVLAIFYYYAMVCIDAYYGQIRRCVCVSAYRGNIFSRESQVATYGGNMAPANIIRWLLLYADRKKMVSERLEAIYCGGGTD